MQQRKADFGLHDFINQFFFFVTDADHFSECVESHAYETYDKFLKASGGWFNILNTEFIHLSPTFPAPFAFVFSF